MHLLAASFIATFLKATPCGKDSQLTEHIFGKALNHPPRLRPAFPKDVERVLRLDGGWIRSFRWCLGSHSAEKNRETSALRV